MLLGPLAGLVRIGPIGGQTAAYHMGQQVGGVYNDVAQVVLLASGAGEILDSVAALSEGAATEAAGQAASSLEGEAAGDTAASLSDAGENVGPEGPEGPEGNPGEQTAENINSQDCGTSKNCFVAGTEVLLGDGTTEVPIQNITVGQRVATDGGVANSSDGQVAADPDSTAVDPSTWRLITITYEDWQIQALEPESWIAAHHLTTGGNVELGDVVDLQEMGINDDYVGTVVSIGACPPIQGGPGRVVLATVSHLNDVVMNLTLTDSAGDSATIGVTEYHTVYTEDRGWVEVEDLKEGELVRGDHGDLTVTGLSGDPGTYRVYNLDVEDDHVYYVSDLDALVHNTYPEGFIVDNNLSPTVAQDFEAQAMMRFMLRSFLGQTRVIR